MATTDIDEIAEIKRYEDFSTIDWVQDAAREQLRQRVRRSRSLRIYGRSWHATVLAHLWELYESIQGWIVVSCIGASIGTIAAMLNIITEWLSDIKLGYCTTAFYLNESFCCSGAENGCPEWHHWSSWSIFNYLIFVILSVCFATMSAFLVKSYAPYAAGSGISEIKCIVSGFVMKGFLGGWTLLIKSLGLPLAIASGLSVGKEGPSVHYAVCAGNVIARCFSKYRRNASKMREILTACAATGVAVAFGSPIGGVIFSLEEISSNLSLKTMWRSYFCALFGTAVLAAINPFRTGQLVMFQVHYDRDWHFFEIIFFIVLGVFGGLYGIFVSKWNLVAQAFRKKHLGNYAIEEAACLAGITAIICYFNKFLKIDMTESMEILFKECEGGEDYDGLCEPSTRSRQIASLLFATVVRTLLVIISYGSKVPAGIFVPSMAIGASFGRLVGIIVQALHETHPESAFFAACSKDEPCITPGTYAFLGAGAALCGIMNITVSVVVIMFELTGALTYILPTMIVVGVTKIINEKFGKGGIADQAIFFNGFPFLDNKEEHVFGVNVSDAMIESVSVLPSYGMTLGEVEEVLKRANYGGFPVVEDTRSMMLSGYIGRTELQYAIERAKRSNPLQSTAKCFFTTPDQRPLHPASVSAVTGNAAAGGSNGTSDSYGNSALVSSGNDSSYDLPVGLTTMKMARSASPQPAPLRIDIPGDQGEAPDLMPSVVIGSQASAGGMPVEHQGAMHVDFSQFIDITPISVNPNFPLETVMELFKKLGPSVILIEYHGRLCGLITPKDLLKYQFNKH
ncbi:chloride channel [Lipomyces tetrasporus]|uniref:Chloride channel protein n=1 Tax=Lipomyces tetrasporus TaxID=54092 RepID=A0AAD7QR03_9ASCO|nr:chloride channel [Lipomyces tetrasporus]KAJ8099693.1 chloride channel [Lipomyces tetrasporus]